MPVFHFFANLVCSYCPGLEAVGSVGYQCEKPDLFFGVVAVAGMCLMSEWMKMSAQSLI